ncbi:PTS lactose/cellobiose transporter subunit IIA [Metabacillus sp. RGM 3146]|uniref:PTS lactose/cellobiose transporter subunit IIA n=1 Tax=Metabacillus sp. RGM 3146 TaxID=3401092 RepID=UPI003B99B41B
MEDMELVAFQMISQVGSARSSFMEALQFAREGNNEAANEKITEAQSFLTDGHRVHAELIRKEASGEKVEISLLVLHAEDLMISTETLGELAKEMIFMYQEFRK